jgi:hypothetical protein
VLIRFTNEQLDASTMAYAMLLELYLHHHMPGTWQDVDRLDQKAPVAPNGAGGEWNISLM